MALDLQRLAALAQVYNTLAKPQQDEQDSRDTMALRMQALQQEHQAHEDDVSEKAAALVEARNQHYQDLQLRGLSEVNDAISRSVDPTPILDGLDQVAPGVSKGIRDGKQVRQALAIQNALPALKALHPDIAPMSDVAMQLEHNYPGSVAQAMKIIYPKGISSPVPVAAPVDNNSYQQPQSRADVDTLIAKRVAAAKLIAAQQAASQAEQDKLADAYRYQQSRDPSPHFVPTTFGPVFNQ